MEMGTGKTRTIIECLRRIYNKDKVISNTLIVCPLIVKRNWVAEIKKYSKIPEKSILVPEGTVSKKAEQILKHKGIVIVNYDAFIQDDFVTSIIKWEPNILILDESHRCKNPSAKRTKRIMKISESMHKYAHKFIMTGTPVTNDQLDLWSQFYILDNGETFGDSFFGYRAKYFWDLNAGKRGSQKYFPLWVPKKSINDELQSKIALKSVVARKKDCLDLPPLVRQEVNCEMGVDQKRSYDSMKKDFIAYLNSAACIAPLAITKALRLQQILSGFLPLDDGSIHVFQDNPRLKVLQELLEDICVEGKNKCIIWSVFKQDYVQLKKVCEELKIEYREIHGAISEREKFRAMEEFETSPEVKVIIGSPGAGGIGINLVSASYSIWYSRNFNMEQDQQAEARNHRGGSERHEKITRIDIVVPGSMDKIVLDSLRDKKNIAESILSIGELL
jgi:SNF2 family DNA or RNA helicase